MSASQSGRDVNGHRVSATKSTHPRVPDFDQAARQSSQLTYQGVCLICDVVHGANEQCPALNSKIRIRLALDQLKISAVQGKGLDDSIAMRRAILLSHLRSIEIQRP
jgi:hypothetical protein